MRRCLEERYAHTRTSFEHRHATRAARCKRTRTLRDAPGLTLLSITRLTYGARKAATWPMRIWLAYLALIAILTAPVLLLPWRALQLRQRRTTLYVHRDQRRRITAVLAVTARPGRWHVSDHATRRPGTGAGTRLRSQLLPELFAAADNSGITVHAVAATAGLATIYTAAVPGLRDEGRAMLLGRRLRRASMC